MSDLTSIEKLKTEKLFGMESGYVLSFSNRTFSEFIVENTGIDISDSKYNYASGSKANRLRAFWQQEPNPVVGQLLLALLDYWNFEKQTQQQEITPAEQALWDESRIIAKRLKQVDFKQHLNTIQPNSDQRDSSLHEIGRATLMTDNKRPLKVFLCHAHSDQIVVRDLYDRLTYDGVDAWLDKEKLVGGQNFEYEISNAVHDSDVILVCLSKEFNRAGFRQKEVKWALDAAMRQPEGEIFIIPLRLDDCDTLNSLRQLHWVNLFEVDGYEVLMRSLSVRANNVGATINKNLVLSQKQS